MAPPVSFTKTALSYPLYAADFDPYNRGYLVVGGGGGEGRSGVGNKITLLDISSRTTISTAAEIYLSRDEDSVTSLANLATKDGLVTFAGINSSAAEKKAGKNEHLRSFIVDYPAKKRRLEEEAAAPADKESEPVPGRIELLGKASLFSPQNATGTDSYQRVTRLSPAQKREWGTKRLGAIATGLAPEGEVVIFDATTSSPSSAAVVQRITPEDGAQAEDIDVAESSDGTFRVAYCTAHSVSHLPVSYDFEAKSLSTKASEPILAYSTPSPDVLEGNKKRPKYRSLRWLTPEHLLLLSNYPRKTGAELSILQLSAEGGSGQIALHKRLPKSMRAATGLDICALDADPVTGARQIIIAVAGQDISIEILTIDYNPKDSPATGRSLGKLRSFTTLREVHPVQMTAIRFSSFHPPAQPRTSSTLPQYVNLASVSMGNTVVVDTFALTPLNAKSKDSRYVLSTPGRERLETGMAVFIIAFVLLVGAVLWHSYVELKGGTPQHLGFHRFLPPGARSFMGERPYVLDDAELHKEQQMLTDPVAGKRGLRHLLEYRQTRSDQQKVVMVRNSPTGELQTEVHDADEEDLTRQTGAKKWEDMEHHEREKWKERLIKAGHWSVEEGETILKGVLFSEWAGLVGGAVLG